MLLSGFLPCCFPAGVEQQRRCTPVKLQSEKSCVPSATGKLWCDQSFKITYMCLRQIAVEGNWGKALQEETAHFACDWRNENQLFQTSHPCPDPPFSNSLCIVLSPVAVADSEGFGEYIKKYATREECHGPAWAALPSLCSHSTSCVSKEGGDGSWDRPYHSNPIFDFPSAFSDVEHDPWPSALTVPVLKELRRSVEGHRHRILPDHKNRLERMWWHGPWRWECGYSTPYFIN